jgi:hypothetical protein
MGVEVLTIIFYHVSAEKDFVKPKSNARSQILELNNTKE